MSLNISRDLNDHLTECGTHEELEAKIDCYNRVILATLDKHAPQKTKLVKVSHKQPWFTDRIKDKIRVRQEKGNSVGSKTLMTIIIKHFTIKDDTAPTSLNQHKGNFLKER